MKRNIFSAIFGLIFMLILVTPFMLPDNLTHVTICHSILKDWFNTIGSISLYFILLLACLQMYYIGGKIFDWLTK
jgi:hypothetical protein